MTKRQLFLQQLVRYRMFISDYDVTLHYEYVRHMAQHIDGSRFRELMYYNMHQNLQECIEVMNIRSTSCVTGWVPGLNVNVNITKYDFTISFIPKCMMTGRKRKNEETTKFAKLYNIWYTPCKSAPHSPPTN